LASQTPAAAKNATGFRFDFANLRWKWESDHQHGAVPVIRERLKTVYPSSPPADKLAAGYSE